ncbi:16S rRNA (cytidine(1402)-2'-O)-methyltransferase [Herbiconiux sp. L3-i23]|uniref:16S rRNA (cytidine(1402)-2'-O)-methyltransferase n=1 Tax=Herbiconiux sp. L3-i23 TaxID=2905871 RepID=UPI00204ED310|nr:16S rRNA (cytidine(1402)-2'-O)-methyltransferase [Herbiconiux sp. L3-i23]BDI23646.1 ribosomal RNA small subunit methyltransferase I [Herbiconiux sp. L3-i23]
MLVLAATPIGNLGDATGRLVETLKTATVIAAEDTRVVQRLMRGLGVESRPRLISLNDHNERERIGELVALAADADVLVVSDAGMPTVSDPGYRLVAAAVDAGVAVTALPGASAVPTALAVSGLPTDRFAFEGFPPRKQGERRALLASLARESRTLVFFESPQRLGDFLADLSETFGADRRVVVCRELTKLHEEVVRGTAADLAERFVDGARGEICVVVEGAAAAVVSLEDGVRQVLALVASGARLKEAASEVGAETGLSRRDLYEAALAARR